MTFSLAVPWQFLKHLVQQTVVYVHLDDDDDDDDDIDDDDDDDDDDDNAGKSSKTLSSRLFSISSR